MGYSIDEILDASEVIASCFLNGTFSNLDILSLDKTDSRFTALRYLLDYNNSREVPLLISGSTVFVDRGISQSIKHLNDIGLNTLYSCEGHYKQEPYIMIDGLVNVSLEGITVEYNLLRNSTILRGSLGFDNLDYLDKLVDFNYKILSLDRHSYSLGLFNIRLSDYNKIELQILDFLTGSDVLPNASLYRQEIYLNLLKFQDDIINRFPSVESRLYELLDIFSKEQKMSLF